MNLKIDDSGNVSGSMTNGKIDSGARRNSSIQFTYSNFFGNRGVFTGKIVGGTMSGTYTQSVGTVRMCRWQASVVNEGPGIYISQSARPGRDPEPDYSILNEKKLRAAHERDAQSFLTAGAAAARICTYADQMVAAGRFSQAAEAFRLMGDQRRQGKADSLARQASARADECKRKQNSGKALAAKPSANTQTAQAKQIKKACRDLTEYARKLGKDGALEASLKVRLQIRLKCK